MFNWNDIVIIGDSFAGERTEHSDWPVVLTTSLTNSNFINKSLLPRGNGFHGAAWWSTRKLLLTELKRSIKVLVICHTSKNRIPSDNDYALNAASINARHGMLPDEIYRAGEMYFKYLHSVDYAAWAQLQWYKELDDMLLGKIPYIVHLPCFHDSVSYCFKSGITAKELLFTLASNFSGTNRNHFTTDENINLGKSLARIIMNMKEFEGNIVKSIR